MQLGAFSISLAVNNLQRSKEFYAKLGFEPSGGDGEHFQMMRNGDTVIGLFQGMFNDNILTFNPGWNQQAETLDKFTDIRELQKQLKAAGMTFSEEADEDGTGPDSFVLLDPDGNPVLVDQHVD